MSGNNLESMDKTLLVVLQNAYGVEKGYIPSYERKSFRECHTGRRLKEVLPDGVNIEIINSNPSIGSNADSCFPPDTSYVENQINEIKPQIVLSCGKVAEKAIRKLALKIPVIYMPHPAYRALSKEMTSQIKEELEKYV